MLRHVKKPGPQTPWRETRKMGFKRSPEPLSSPCFDASTLQITPAAEPRAGWFPHSTASVCTKHSLLIKPRPTPLEGRPPAATLVPAQVMAPAVPAVLLSPMPSSVTVAVFLSCDSGGCSEGRTQGTHSLISAGWEPSSSPATITPFSFTLPVNLPRHRRLFSPPFPPHWASDSSLLPRRKPCPQPGGLRRSSGRELTGC